MSETLVIRLRAAEEAPASWLIVDSNGARSGPVQSGPVADALSASQARRVVLLVPGSEVTLAEPELPVRGGARLAQAVPFALEEQLASDVESLHFAVGARTAGSNLMIGLIFTALAIFLGRHCLAIVYLIPLSVLGVLLLFAGSQLALTVLDLKDRKELFVCLIILGITLATHLAAGFTAGIAIAYLLKWKKLSV